MAENNKQMTETNLIYLEHNRLHLHPENIRLYYPDEQVAEMAESIRASGGVWQALLVVAIESRPGEFYVVDGNMRLAGARKLAQDCPPLKCEIMTDMAHVDQLLAMAITSQFHYPKDPISKARHYRRLNEQEGLTFKVIADRMGLSQSTIHNTIKLLELDEPVQELLMKGELNPDTSLIRLLIKIPNRDTRIALAERFARNGTSGKQMARSIRHVLSQMEQLGQPGQPEQPGSTRTTEVTGTRPKKKPGLALVKSKEKQPPVETGIPVKKITDMAGQLLCPGCQVDGLGKKCWTCPGPYELIQWLVESAEYRAGQAEEQGQIQTQGRETAAA